MLRAQRDLELLAEQQILDDQRRPAPEHRAKRMDEQDEEIAHGRSIATGSSPPLGSIFAAPQPTPPLDTSAKKLILYLSH